jgi:hypothetical protein
MLSNRLIEMVQDHATQLMGGLVGKLKTHPKTPSYHGLPDAEIQNRAYTVYKNLGTWMEGQPPERIRGYYEELGRERLEEGVPLHELIYALILTKNHLLDYVRSCGLAGTVLEIYSQQELRREVTNFFDKAIYYAVLGYEEAMRGRTRDQIVGTQTILGATPSELARL